MIQSNEKDCALSFPYAIISSPHDIDTTVLDTVQYCAHDLLSLLYRVQLLIPGTAKWCKSCSPPQLCSQRRQGPRTQPVRVGLILDDSETQILFLSFLVVYGWAFSPRHSTRVMVREEC